MNPSTLKSIGNAFTIPGCLLLAANLSWSGVAFPLMLAGSLLWFASAFPTADKPLALLNFVYIVINIVGICRWLT